MGVEHYQLNHRKEFRVNHGPNDSLFLFPHQESWAGPGMLKDCVL